MIVPRPRTAPVEGGILRRLLGSDHATFWSNHYGQRPYAGAGQAAILRHLLDDPLITALIEATACDLTAVRDGRLHPGPRPSCRADADRLHADGYSLVFRHVERHAGAVAAVARSLVQDLHARLDAHVYVTPADHFSFGWHFDAEEVFFLHLEGVKDFLLRENTVHTAPLRETMTRDLRLGQESSPTVQCRLQPGDWLYIPSGWWHRAMARSPARSLSLGLMPPTVLDALETVRRRLMLRPRWRQRLPALGDAVPRSEAEAVASIRELLMGLAPELMDAWRETDPRSLIGEPARDDAHAAERR